MEGRLNMVGFMTLLVLGVMVHGSMAQTTHVVGDSLGWLVPPGGEAAYRTWAAAGTFRVGDRLVFNFTTGQHDVAEVNRAAFDSCNSSSTISMSTNGPATITLNSSGEHYFFCTYSGHCSLGQKLGINVSAAAAGSPAPTPQPATRPPRAAPAPAVGAPTPSRVGRNYTVGDNLGWTVPPAGQVAYQTWARGRNFAVGDTLVFNFQNGNHDVVEVTRAEFDSCNITSTTPPITTSPARVPLTSAGEHYYVCNFPQHCSLGQKLAINVTAGSVTSTPPTEGPAQSPSSTTTPPPSSGGPRASNPFTPSTPSQDTAPPPPSNSAPSFAAAALPFTFLAVAFAFLYN
ncbi:hypothetical protein CDL12_17418 [Handroanthus impetiginosus]|uniref:Phytocyanin domain-containing protein n=1 Tax=Handroanthus impetiginosus TaxID=429701 RepID=A0A2G9GXJ2_9LAMI|nr:hypothetical protein CDL12_17418 [Handroanthus impetiginosus]